MTGRHPALRAVARAAGVFAALALAAAIVLAFIYGTVAQTWAVTLVVCAVGVGWVRVERRASRRRAEELAAALRGKRDGWPG